MNNPKNKHSSYHYYRKQQIEFFPEGNIYEFNNTHTKQLNFEGDVAELKKYDVYYKATREGIRGILKEAEDFIRGRSFDEDFEK